MNYTYYKKMFYGLVKITVIGLSFFGALTHTLYSSENPLPSPSPSEAKKGIEYVSGVVTFVPPDHSGASENFVTTIKVKVMEGAMAGSEIAAPIPNDPPYAMNVKEGDKVMIITDYNDVPPSVGVEDHYRIGGIIPILTIAALPVIAIGGRKGITSLAALAVTVFLIFSVMIKAMLSGFPPVPAAILTSAIITVVTVFLIAGKGKKTVVAVTGTIGGLCLAAIMAWISTGVLHLSGLSGHESIFLQGMKLDLDFRGLLLSAMIIGALGAVMDVCMSIASSLEEIAATNPDITPGGLLSSGIKIGSDMLGTMTNTLVLAYTGSSLTLILLIEAQGREFPFIRLMNMEFICVEVVRSASGLFGMATAIPLSALVASILFTKAQSTISSSRRNKKRPGQNRAPLKRYLSRDEEY